MRLIVITIILQLSYTNILLGQHGLANGGMEAWRRGQFRCCGRNVDTPLDWGIPEQSCGINFNKFVYLEENPYNVHSGRYCALLMSDTSFFNNVGLQPGMLVYGGYQNALDSGIYIGQPVPQYGMPIDSNPIQLDFWLMMSHDLSDTFSYMYLFTRWDSLNHREDTLAFATADVPDTHVISDTWFEVKDSIRYLRPGQADTVKMIFYGGRFGNPALAGNITWIDDIRLLYTGEDTSATTGIDNPSYAPFRIYPNPAIGMLNIRSYEDTRYIMSLEDELGRMILQEQLQNTFATIDVSGLSAGIYIAHIYDAVKNRMYQQRLSIAARD